MATLPYDTNALIAQTKAMLDQTKAQGTTAFAGSSYDKGFQGGVQLGNTGAPSATGYNPVQTVSPTGVVYNSTVGTPPPVPKTMDASSIASSLGGDNTALDTTGDKFVLPSSDILNVDNGVTDMMSIKPSDILASLTDTQGEKESKTISETLAGLFKKQGTQKAETIQAENAMGIPAMQNQLRDLNNQILQTQTQAAQAMMTSEDRLAPTFAIRGEQAQIERMRATKALGLNALAQAVQGNIASAQSSVDRMIELEFAPIEAEIEYQKQALTMNEAKISRKEAKLASALEFRLNEQQRIIDDQKAERDGVWQLIFSATTNATVPTEILQKAKDAKTKEDALVLLAPYLSPQEQVLTQKEILENRKLQAEIDKINTEAGTFLQTGEISDDSVAAIGIVNGLLDNNAYEGATGAPGIGAFSPFGGTKVQNTSNQIDQLKGILALENRKKLKGGGAISDFETKMLNNSISAMGEKVPVLGTYKISNEQMGQELKKIRGTLGIMAGYQVPVVVRDISTGEEKEMMVDRESANKLYMAGYTIKFQ